MSNKKYTLMFFNENQKGKVRYFTVTSRILQFTIFLFLIFVMLLSFGVYSVLDLRQLSKSLETYKEVNHNLARQLSSYSSQLDFINNQMDTVLELGIKVEDLLSYQNGTIPTQSFGIDLYNTSIEKQFDTISIEEEYNLINNLNRDLKEATSELVVIEDSLSKIVKELEIKKTELEYVPTIWPIKRRLTSPYGFRINPITRRGVDFHGGLDLGANYREPVYTTISGVVAYAGARSGYGRLVTIDSGHGYMTRYGHNSKVLVKEGQIVKKGDPIALAGSSGRSTGTHVHYEILLNGVGINPYPFLIINQNQ